MPLFLHPMRCLGLILILCGAANAWAAEAAPRPATAAEVELFKDALRNSGQDADHWAYTETTTITTSKGRRRPPKVVRFDPSKPYAEQYTVLPSGGQPPSARDIKKYREKGEKRGERRAKAIAWAEGAKAPPKIDEDSKDMDLSRVLVIQESIERIMFEVPIKSGRKDFPAENFQVRIQVSKPKRQIEQATLRVMKAFRVKMLAKVNAGDIAVEFGVVDPAFGPVVTKMTGGFGVSFLAIPIEADAETTRTEWQRVKPYDERFTVKLGPLQMFGF